MAEANADWERWHADAMVATMHKASKPQVKQR